MYSIRPNEHLDVQQTDHDGSMRPNPITLHQHVNIAAEQPSNRFSSQSSFQFLFNVCFVRICLSDVVRRTFLITNRPSLPKRSFPFVQALLSKLRGMENDSSIQGSITRSEQTNALSIEDPFERGKSMFWDVHNEYFDGELDFFPLSNFEHEHDTGVDNALILSSTEAEESLWPTLNDTDLGVSPTQTPDALQSIPYLTSAHGTAVVEQTLHESAPENSTVSDESVTAGNNEDNSLELKIKNIQKKFTAQNTFSRNIPAGALFKKEIQKPPTTAGITLDDLKAVFHLERPKAEKRLRLKRTTFSNLSRYYGISKWPFRTIRDAMNRMNANEKMLRSNAFSKEKIRKLKEQQRLLSGVIDLIYSDPKESKDTNTLAVLLRIVSARENPREYPDM